MKNSILLATVAVTATLVSSSQAQTKELSVWVEPPTGSLLGRGVVRVGPQNNAATAAKLSASEKPSFRTALNDLDSQSGTIVEGWSLIGPAVSWQTGVPRETLEKQRAATHLSFGELLVANSFASGSGKSFNDVVRLKAKSASWSQLAQQLNINIDSVTARLRTASDSVRYAEARRRQRREQNVKDAMRDTQNLSRANPGQ